MERNTRVFKNFVGIGRLKWLILGLSIAASAALLFILLQKCGTENFSHQTVYEQTLHAHYKRLARSIDQHSVVFLGSSTVQALPVGEIVPNAFNLGIGGEKLAGLHDRVRDYKNIKQAKLIIFAAGFNDLCSTGRTPMAAQFRRIVKLFPESTSIIVSALQPATTTTLCADLDSSLRDYNDFLGDYCGQRPNCKFIDLPKEISISSNRENRSINQYFEDDKIHLNSKGYDVWARKIKEQSALAAQGR